MASSNSNKTSVPEAKSAMNKFKMEVATEIGVDLKDGYNGDLTSAQSGSIGGEMVRQMIKRQEEQIWTASSAVRNPPTGSTAPDSFHSPDVCPALPRIYLCSVNS